MKIKHNPFNNLQCQIHNIYTPIPEYKFHPVRKWRFDYAWPNKMLAVEIEGGIWIQGRHNRASGFAKDLIKYNAAAELGWRLLRYQPNKIDYKQVKRILCYEL